MISYSDNYLKSFKDLYSFEKRQKDAEQIKAKYPSRIPIICEKNRFSTNSPNIDKKKYLVPYNLTLGQFIYQIRKRLNLSPEVALFFFTGGFISNLYAEYKDADGFLYIYYAVENTFGNNFDLQESDNICLIKNNERHCILHINYMCNIYSNYFEKL